MKQSILCLTLGCLVVCGLILSPVMPAHARHRPITRANRPKLPCA